MDKVHATLKRKLEWVRGGVLSGHVAPQGLLALYMDPTSILQLDLGFSLSSLRPESKRINKVAESHKSLALTGSKSCASLILTNHQVCSLPPKDVCPFVPEIFKFNIKEGHDLEQSSDKSDVDEEIEWGVLENEELCDKMIEMVEREDAGWLPEHLQWRRESHKASTYSLLSAKLLPTLTVIIQLHTPVSSEESHIGISGSLQSCHTSAGAASKKKH
ncbi:hypothetical protein EV401DRAFT_1883952 [Pisolithus croceorrhizus]|nr:hypothetical protein EV401DRAFT_1883952 [Pisolithus croceorrhizus]